MAKANGTTVTDLTAVKNCMTEVEQCLDEMASLKGSYMADCKELREEISSIFMRAKDQGVNVRAVKALLKTRMLARGITENEAQLDIDQLASYRIYREAAEAWDTTPLAKAAKSQPELAQ